MTVPAIGRDDVQVVAMRPAMTRGEAPSAGVGSRPWSSGSVDVETLATWAYRDQMVDRFQSAGLHAIERELAGMEPSASSTDGCAALARIAHMGGRIDVGMGRITDVVHPAAEAVASVLSYIDGGDTVAWHARTGSRPGGWALPAKRWRPVMWEREGLAAWERSDEGTRFTPLISLGSPEDVAARRVDYTAWWEALDVLAWRLSMKAMGFVVLRPGVPREPWLPSVRG